MPKKVLIAEDEKPLAKALELKLRGAGFDVTVVGDGQDAIAALKDAHDILLLDLIMPRADGFKVLEHVRDAGIKIKSIVLSNLGQTEDIDRAKKLGALDYFVKADTPLATIVARVQALTG